jgi:hypothetical protein
LLKTTFFYEFNMCFDQTSSDVDSDCGGTHSINDICMKIWKCHIFKKKCRLNWQVTINIQKQHCKMYDQCLPLEELDIHLFLPFGPYQIKV